MSAIAKVYVIDPASATRATRATSSRSTVGLRSSATLPPELHRDYDQLEELLVTQHGHTVDNSSIEENRFYQFTSEEMGKRKLTVEGGLLCFGVEKRVLTTITEQGIMAVMFEDGDIYGAYPIPGSIFHSSLYLPDKKRVALANLKVHKGELIQADDESGHLAPFPDRIEYLLSELIHHQGCCYTQHFTIKTSHHPIILNEKRISMQLQAKRLNELLRHKHSHSNSNPKMACKSREPSSGSSTPREIVAYPSPNSASQKARKLSQELENLSVTPTDSPSPSGGNTPILRNRRVLSVQIEDLLDKRLSK